MGIYLDRKVLDDVEALIPLATENWLYERYKRIDFRALVKLIAAQKRTGSLTINFSQGAIGSLDWKQKNKKEAKS